MIIEQISVFAENRVGGLADITDMLADASIDIDALTIADTAEYGILRLIVDSPKKALTVLKAGGFVVNLTPVIAIKMDDKPGSLSKIIALLSQAEVGIEYLYAFVAREIGNAYLILRVEDVEKGEEILKQASYSDDFKIGSRTGQ